MLCDSGAVNDQSSLSITGEGALRQLSAPGTSICRQARIGQASCRNDREGAVRLRGGPATEVLSRMIGSSPGGTTETRNGPVTCFTEEPEPQGKSLLRLLIDETESLNRLYNIVRHAGCEILLCDEKEDLICRYGRPLAGNLGSFILWPRVGDVVAEGFEGRGSAAVVSGETAGQVGRASGTLHAIPSRTAGCQRVSYAANVGSNFCAETIFNLNGEVMGYLKVLLTDAAMTTAALALIGAAVKVAARAIEERAFRTLYSREWIISLVPDEQVGCGMLMAVDRR